MSGNVHHVSDPLIASFRQPPRQVCLLRLSAIGDTCHVVPLLRALQRAWPDTRFTWIIGRIEARLMGVLLPEIEFITVDKRSFRGAASGLRQALKGRHFDLLLHLQTSLRSSLYSRLVSAPVRLGYDRSRGREMQWLFTNARLAPHAPCHALESYMDFAAALGIEDRHLAWDLPIPAAARAWAAERIPEGTRALLVSPCSSHRVRSWSVERYAAVIDHAVRRHGMQAVICGAPNDYERGYGAAIEGAAQVPVTNLVGQDTLPQLLALLERATVLLSPDAGPAHMATMVNTPVIGLYGCTRLQRTGPYLSQHWCVDRFDAAARRFKGRSAAELRWTEDVEVPGAMDLIEVTDVTGKLDALLAG